MWTRDNEAGSEWCFRYGLATAGCILTCSRRCLR